MSQITKIKAIDSNCHLNIGHPFDSTVYSTNNIDYLKRTWGGDYYTVIVNKQLVRNYNGDFLDSLSKEANVEYTFLSTYAAETNATAVEEGNEYLLDLIKKKDNYFGWAVIDPRNEETFSQAKEMLSSGKCVGIRLNPKNHNYSLADFGAKIFDFAAEFKTNILLCDSQESVLDFADKYSELNFIVAGYKFDEILCSKNKNIYTDISGGNSLSNYALENLDEKIFDYILFCSDNYAVGAQRGRVEYAVISQENKAKILRGNAEKLFGKYIKG